MNQRRSEYKDRSSGHSIPSEDRQKTDRGALWSFPKPTSEEIQRFVGIGSEGLIRLES